MARFLRHFETRVDPHRDRGDWELSEDGQQRAEEYAEGSDLSDVEAIHCSPERKALRSAGPAARAAGVEMDVMEELREVERGGFVEDVTEYEARAHRFLRGEDVEGWEEIGAVRERIRAALERVGGEALVVVHGLWFAVLMGGRVDPVAFWDGLGFGEEYRADPAELLERL